MLNKIKFPIFKLRSHEKIETKDNISYVHALSGILILDNKNLKGNSLALRRLKIPIEKLYKINIKIDNALGLLCQASANTYIDSSGFIFVYKKTKFVPIVYKKILSVKHVEGLGVFIVCAGINAPLLIGNIGGISAEYAGLVKWLNGYIVYELCDTPGSKKRIKV